MAHIKISDLEYQADLCEQAMGELQGGVLSVNYGGSGDDRSYYKHNSGWTSTWFSWLSTPGGTGRLR